MLGTISKFTERFAASTSPFLFYIDDGNSRVIGSSPEAQLLVRNGMAEVHPIAGTVRRSRVESENIQAIAMLREDEKENAEHTMLLDLARNDLNRSCQASEVTHCKEVQMFSHVIHLVSKVEAKLKSGIHAAQVFADTFRWDFKWSTKTQGHRAHRGARTSISGVVRWSCGLLWFKWGLHSCHCHSFLLLQPRQLDIPSWGRGRDGQHSVL